MSILLIEDNKLWYNFIINNISFDVDLCTSLQDFINLKKKNYQAAIIDLFIPLFKNNNFSNQENYSTYGNGIGFYLKYINPEISKMIIGNSMDFKNLKKNFFNYTVDKSLYYDFESDEISIEYIKDLERIIKTEEINNKWRFL